MGMPRLAGAVLLVAGLCLSLAATATGIRIGILAPTGRESARSNWAELERWLGQALPGEELHFAYLSPEELNDAVSRHQLEFVLTNPGHYITLETRYGASRIATLESGLSPLAGEVIGSAVVVPAGSPLRTLDDLRQRRIVAVAPDAFGGYQIAVRELLKRGINPERDLAARQFTGFPVQNLFAALDAGAADAAIVGSCQMEMLQAQGLIAATAYRVLPPAAPPPAGYRCRVSTPLYPDWPFATLPGTAHPLSRQVAVALLTMPRGTDGAGFTVPTDYAAVHGLFRDLQTGPYAYLAEWNWQDWARRYWDWLLAGLVLLAVWVLHTIRADRLVEQRTRALRQEMAARAAAEEQGRRQREQLDHLSRLGLLGEISSQLAHEINQPLTAIGNYARGMVRRVENGRMEADGLIEAGHEITAQAERAAAIVQRVRTFARKRVSERQPVAIDALVADTVRLFAVACPGIPPVETDNRLPSGSRLHVDGLQVQQVLFNLLKNASDAMAGLPASQRIIRLELAPDEAGRMRITVTDRGPELDAGTLSRMGTPFFTSKPDGLGIGLSISQSIIEAHGGHLDWQPRSDGPGLCVLFTLPLLP